MTKFFSSLVFAAIAAAFVPQAVKAQGPPVCLMGNGTLNGVYVATGTGTVTGVGPATGVTLAVYNGDGTAAAIFSTGSFNGAVSTLSNISGTYTVNRDCTGTKTFGSGPSAAHYNFVVTPDGSTIYWIVTDNGFTLSGTGVRIERHQ
jgi:hypothetical protein